MSDHLPQVQCNLCGILKDPSDLVDKCRCKQCDNLRIRLYRTTSQTEKDHFAKLNKSRSEEFYKEHFDKFKDALSTALTTAIKDVVTVSEETGFEGAGTYMDEADLKEKYKAKPGRAETIMKNSNKYYCDNAECQMYEDLGYTSTNMTGTKRDVASTTEMEQESKIKGNTKKPRLRTATRQTMKTRQTSRRLKNNLQKTGDFCDGNKGSVRRHG